MNSSVTFICKDIFTDKCFDVRINEGEIISKEPVNSCNTKYYLGPGLFDLQINGFYGVDFNQLPLCDDKILGLVKKLKEQGITKFLPTIITNSTENLKAILSALDHFISEQKLSNEMPGMHLERPFLSPIEGAKGAHNARYITPPDIELLKEINGYSGGRIKLITMSPEWDNSTLFIEKCVDMNIKVAIGHTNASPDQINEAVKAGASLSTHLGNASAPLIHRNNNFLFEQLANEDLWASVIADGFHLPNSFLKIALKMKGDKTILVSDSTMFAGMGAGIYETHIGGKVELSRNGRLAIFNNSEYLAGSAVSLLDCVNFLIKSKLCSLERAWRYASINPASFLNLQYNVNSLIFEADNDGVKIVNVLN